MLVCGIDPGLSGAVAFYNAATGGLCVDDMPVLASGKAGRNELDLAALAALLRRDDIANAFVEDVHPMPSVPDKKGGKRRGMGATSAFRFGGAKYAALAQLAAFKIPYTLVAPVTWKKALKVPAAKDGARARASQLLPRHAEQWKLKKHDGRAEAALIALYGAMELARRPAR